jgi:chloramphenicol 3-O-phosphotransferase
LTRIILLTGPPAAGKNAVGEALANRLEHYAAIDVDAVRHMVRGPHRAPWKGAEGRAQHALGVRNACALAINFIEAGPGVIILDVLFEETAGIYEEMLGRSGPRIIQLMPTFEEIKRRNRARPILKEEEWRRLYERQSRFTGYDERIDNTNLSPEEVTERILR